MHGLMKLAIIGMALAFGLCGMTSAQAGMTGVIQIASAQSKTHPRVTRHHAAPAAKAPKAETPAPPQIPQKIVGITLVSDIKKPVPVIGGTIYFAYLDGATQLWQKSSQQTDAAGRCAFPVPLAAGGETYFFLFSDKQDKLDKDIELVNAHQAAPWRIPAPQEALKAEELQRLELSIDGTWRTGSEGWTQVGNGDILGAHSTVHQGAWGTR